MLLLVLPQQIQYQYVCESVLKAYEGKSKNNKTNTKIGIMQNSQTKPW